MSDDETSTETQLAETEADGARKRIAAKREQLAELEASKLQAVHDAAAEHELALLAAEEARLDAKLGSMKTPEDVAAGNANNLQLAKDAAALYSEGRLSPDSPIDVAAAVAATVANTNDLQPENVTSEKLTPAQVKAAKKAAAEQAAADKDKGGE